MEENENETDKVKLHGVSDSFLSTLEVKPEYACEEAGIYVVESEGVGAVLIMPYFQPAIVSWFQAVLGHCMQVGTEIPDAVKSVMEEKMGWSPGMADEMVGQMRGYQMEMAEKMAGELEEKENELSSRLPDNEGDEDAPE